VRFNCVLPFGCVCACTKQNNGLAQEEQKTKANHQQRVKLFWEFTGPARMEEEKKKPKAKPKPKPKPKPEQKNEAQLQFEQVLRNNQKVLRFVQRIQSTLLNPGIPQEMLDKSANVLQPDTFAEIVEERSTSSLCGWPCCVNPIEQRPGEKYRISWKDHR